MNTKHKMKIIEGHPGYTTHVVYSYRGHRIHQHTRSFDPRNKTTNGYEWSVEFSTGEHASPIGKRTRTRAKELIDQRESKIASDAQTKADWEDSQTDKSVYVRHYSKHTQYEIDDQAEDNQ